MSETATTQHRALIIDDNWHNRNIFRIALESSGYHTDQCENGLDGLTILNEHTFDLLILDLQMPGMDGETVLNKFRADARHRAMHVLVVTANAQMVTDRVSDHADYIMYKPVNIGDFAKFVNRLRGVAV